jgi:hypothetical protein
MQPVHRRRSPSKGPEVERLPQRLLAALLAAPLLEVSLLLSLCIIGGRGGARLFIALPAVFHGVMICLAAALGLMVGLRGLLWLQGHLFYTHFESAKNWQMTAALWAIFAFVVWLAHMLAQ